MLELSEANYIPTWLNADAHFIAVVGAREH
jgi:hypothetical protein